MAQQTSVPQSRPRLAVYLNTDAKPASLQRELETALPALAVTVYGRLRDLEADRATGKLDGLIVSGPYVQAQRLAPALQALRNGKPTERYALLAATAIMPAELAGRTVGVVDLLGRTATTGFVSQLLAVPSSQLRTKLVVKQEDLLVLLQLAAADAVIAPESVVQKLMARSKLPLAFVVIDAPRVPLPGLVITNPAQGERIKAALLALSPDHNALLGLDKWGAP